MTNEEAARLLQLWLDGDPLPNEEPIEHAIKVLRSPGAGAMREALIEVARRAFRHAGMGHDNCAAQVVREYLDDPQMKRALVRNDLIGVARLAISICCGNSSEIPTAERVVFEYLAALPAPEVPEAVKVWAARHDKWVEARETMNVIEYNLRDWIRKEYGI